MSTRRSSLLRVLLASIVLTSTLCWSGTVSAQASCGGAANLSWQAPTQNVDGSPLTNLSGFVIYWGSSQGVYPNSARLTNAAARSYIVQNLCAGTWHFVATAFNSNNIESVFSARASKTIAALPLEVYLISQTRDRVVLVPVGTVPVGVACNREMSIKDANGVVAYQVPRASITWYGSVRTEVAFAKC